MTPRLVPRIGVAIAFIAATLGLLAPGRPRPARSAAAATRPSTPSARTATPREGFRVALDWERFDKDEGTPPRRPSRQVENRFTALVSYGFDERFRCSHASPCSVRNLDRDGAGASRETPTTERLLRSGGLRAGPPLGLAGGAGSGPPDVALPHRRA